MTGTQSPPHALVIYPPLKMRVYDSTFGEVIETVHHTGSRVWREGDRFTTQDPGSGVKVTIQGAKWTPHEASNQTQASTLLRLLLDDHMKGRNDTNSTRALKVPDGTSAAWYILTIIGIYAVIFVFRLASNILRKNDKSLEDVYYSNLTSELKMKGLQGKVAKCSSLTISNRAVLQPCQAHLGAKGGSSGPQTATPETP
ncbi:small integral membrane protein 34 [Chlorocebus sabaeus]|uniref:small integral membrane protein 34 n=1 Tax=Chlorocebus sabaeus TaxID=60711 RepID=UPI003BF989F1